VSDVSRSIQHGAPVACVMILRPFRLTTSTGRRQRPRDLIGPHSPEIRRGRPAASLDEIEAGQLTARILPSARPRDCWTSPSRWR
jgi:hypothetical protein